MRNILLLVLAAVICVGLLYGYVENILHLVVMHGVSGLLILRVLGIFFPPLGIILGLFF